jgi:CRISPR-associated protein Cas1
LILAKQFVQGKCQNQINYLKYLAKILHRDFSKAIDKTEAILESLKFIKGNIEDARGQLFGIEGYIADQYFFALSQIISFPGRQPKSKDPFNIMLNYGYGILYSEIERACLMTGLDPYTGFLPHRTLWEASFGFGSD